MPHLKKILITITLSITLFFQASAQIGINTENTSSYLLYIDGAATAATTNSKNGTISATQMTDDVIVTKQGTIGIGTAPTTDQKLKIKASNVGKAFKMSDGSEALHKALVSKDNTGTATWSSIGGVWYAFLQDSKNSNNPTANTIRKINNYAKSYIADPAIGSINPATGDLTVPYDGAYRCIIYGWMGYGRPLTGSSQEYYVNILYLYANDKHKFSFTATSQMIWGMQQNFFRILDLKAGDKLSIYKNETARLHGTDTGELSLYVEFLY